MNRNREEKDKKNCRLCGGQAELICGLESPDYYHCQNCSLIFSIRGQTLSPASERKRYAEHDNVRNNDGYLRMLLGFLDFVIPYCRGKGRALEFGCGPGPVLGDLLAERGFEVDLYDPYFYPHRLVSSSRYDLITCTEVIEHIGRPKETLELFCRQLVRGGVLGIMTRLHPGFERFADWWYHRDPTHITFYSQKTFEIIADLYPLRLIDCNKEDIAVLRRV